jgi:hypothetical protein
MANWRVGNTRLWVALSIAWIIGWIVFFIRLAVFEAPQPLDYLTILGVTLAPPLAIGLLGWVIQGFRTKA